MTPIVINGSNMNSSNKLSFFRTYLLILLPSITYVTAGLRFCYLLLWFWCGPWCKLIVICTLYSISLLINLHWLHIAHQSALRNMLLPRDKKKS